MKNYILKFKIFSFLSVILLFAFYILHLPGPVSAQAPIPTTVSPTSPVYTDLLVYNLFHTFSCLSVGSSVIGQPCLTYQITKNAQGAIQSVPVLSQVNLQGGALGATTSLIGLLYMNPPVRTVDYLASVGQGFGFVKEAKAQVIGSGAQVLNPILKLWEVSRNIAYLFMIIIFVVIGLMVMFRQRINPQTVITAQAALPGLVIGLILITFSYFFAALLTDTAFIGTNLVGYYFSAAQSKPPQNLVQDANTQNILSIFTPFTKIVKRESVESALASIWDDLQDPGTNRWNPLDLDPQKVLVILTGFIVSQLLMPFGGLAPGIGQVLAGIFSFGGAALAPVSLASFGLSFIAIIILIYAMFRLLLRLINAFLTIIFLTITAPFQFLAAALPGRQGIATAWILNMLANVLAFPAVLAVLYFVAYILGPGFLRPPQSDVFRISQSNQVEQDAFAPVAQAAEGKIVEGATFPLFGGMDLNFIRLLLAFGALVALPAIPDIIARTIGRVGVAGQLIGQELGGSVAQGRGYAGQIQQGTTGLVGQAGSLRDQPGWLYTGPGQWQRITSTTQGISEQQAYMAGLKPGQWTRFKTGLSGLLGKGPVARPRVSNE